MPVDPRVAIARPSVIYQPMILHEHVTLTCMCVFAKRCRLLFHVVPRPPGESRYTINVLVIVLRGNLPLFFFFFEIPPLVPESVVYTPRFISPLVTPMQDVNEAKNTKDTWVRGQLPSADAGAKAGFMMEGWLLAASTKRGAMMTEAPDALAAQNALQNEVRGMMRSIGQEKSGRGQRSVDHCVTSSVCAPLRSWG